MDAERYIAENIGSYLRACAEGEAIIRRWRLMLLGASGDGKTSLLRRLLGKGFIEDHIVTDALETDCKVEITHCDLEWKEYEANHLILLDEGVTQGIGQYINKTKADQIVQPSESVKFDEMVDFEERYEAERSEAKSRLETIFNEQAELVTAEILLPNPDSSKPDFSIPRFVLAIWDLGGQVVYYTLHHVFLRWHCVYILVVNLSRPLDSEVPSHELPPHTRQTTMQYWESIEFWLNMVHSHMVKVKTDAELPSVVLVGTHKDKLHANPLEQDSLAQKYFSELESLMLKKSHFQHVYPEYIAVDSKGGDPENYAKLRSIILELVEGHCSQSIPRPIRWLRLEKKLHELKYDETLTDLDRHLVSYERVQKYAKQFHIETEEDLRIFLEYHHLTADITYCGGEHLGKYIAPHPQWLVDVLRALITLDRFRPKSQKLRQEKDQLQNEGLLQTDGALLPEIWKNFLKDDQTGDVKQYLLDLMVEFDLAVKYEESLYVIPSLLPISPYGAPNFDGLTKNLPALYYKFHSSSDSKDRVCKGATSYDNFLPHGLFQKLISKCSKQGWVWTSERYQDIVSFRTKDVQISLQARST